MEQQKNATLAEVLQLAIASAERRRSKVKGKEQAKEEQASPLPPQPREAATDAGEDRIGRVEKVRP